MLQPPLSLCGDPCFIITRLMAFNVGVCTNQRCFQHWSRHCSCLPYVPLPGKQASASPPTTICKHGGFLNRLCYCVKKQTIYRPPITHPGPHSVDSYFQINLVHWDSVYPRFIHVCSCGSYQWLPFCQGHQITSTKASWMGLEINGYWSSGLVSESRRGLGKWIMGYGPLLCPVIFHAAAGTDWTTTTTKVPAL